MYSGVVYYVLKSSLQTAVENRLTELGETKNAEQVAEIITKNVNGEKLTKQERWTLANSKPSLQVTVEAKNGKLTTQQSTNAQTAVVQSESSNQNTWSLRNTHSTAAQNKQTQTYQLPTAVNGYTAINQSLEKGLNEYAARQQTGQRYQGTSVDYAMPNVTYSSAAVLDYMNQQNNAQSYGVQNRQGGNAADAFSYGFSNGSVQQSRGAENYGTAGRNPVADSANDGRMNSVEMFKKANDARAGFKFISDSHFNALTIEARKNGAVILRGTPEIEAHLEKMDASASTIGNILLFKKDVCISEVLEETYHYKQNIEGLNNDKENRLRTILNEIDAKKYILDNAVRHKVPRNEVELIRKQLESYMRELHEYMKGK